MTQNSEEVLVAIRDHIGMGTIRLYVGEGRSHYYLQVRGRDNVRRLIRLVYPYSIVKRKQLALAWKITELTRTKKKPKYDLEGKRHKLGQQIKALR